MDLDAVLRWNHRVIKHRDGSMEIVEVYYVGFGDDAFGWCDATVYADKYEVPEGDLMALRQQVERFAAALDKPALDVSDKCDKACCKQ